MEDYYKCYAFSKWTGENSSSITKTDILQDTKTDNAERDMNSIIEMCEMDVVCQMYQDLLEEYYMNFPFELLSSERVREKYRKQSEEAEKEVSVQHSCCQNLQSEIENISVENQSLREIIKNQEIYIEELKKTAAMKIFHKQFYGCYIKAETMSKMFKRALEYCFPVSFLLWK